MQNLILDIGGMHCGGCAQIVQHVLEAEPGVHACTVSDENKHARVAFDPGRTSADQLAKAVQRAGYSATVRS